MNKIDFHVHTCVSDGFLSAQELILKMHKEGILYGSITDHDILDWCSGNKVATLERQLNASGKFSRISPTEFSYTSEGRDLCLITGVEVTAQAVGAGGRGSEVVHILGYHVDPTRSEELNAIFAAENERGQERVFAIVRQLIDRGVPITVEEVVEAAAQSSRLSTPHIGSAMYKKRDTHPYFAKRLVDGEDKTDRILYNFIRCEDAPGRIKRDLSGTIGVYDACKAIVAAGGIPVLAHPSGKYDVAQVVTDMRRAVSHAHVGIEAFSSQIDEAHREIALRVAHTHGLIITGGSDYHALPCDPDERKQIGIPCIDGRLDSGIETLINHTPQSCTR